MMQNLQYIALSNCAVIKAECYGSMVLVWIAPCYNVEYICSQNVEYTYHLIVVKEEENV